MPGLELLDLGIIVILLIFLFRGYRKGFLKQTAALAGFVLGVIIALDRYYIVASFLQEHLLLPEFFANLVGFVLLALIISGLINIIGFFLHRITAFIFFNYLDSIGGAGLGLLKGGILVYLGLLLLSQVPYSFVMEPIAASRLAQDFLQITPFVQENIERLFQQH